MDAAVGGGACMATSQSPLPHVLFLTTVFEWQRFYALRADAESTFWERRPCSVHAVDAQWQLLARIMSTPLACSRQLELHWSSVETT